MQYTQQIDFAMCVVQLEEDDDFEEYINRDSWHESAALGDANMRALQKGDIIQLERKGFYKVDEPMLRPGKPLLLFNVPDGHSKGKKGV
jgi:glutamyl-tRNA synthetase